jgi:hypothetical protein
MTHNIMGYGPVVKGSRRLYLAMSLLEAYQETVKAERDGLEIVEWTFQTETGRKMLGLDDGDIYRRPPLERPQGLVRCPRCVGKGCHICRASGETTHRVLAGYEAWQLEPEKGREHVHQEE